MSDIDSMQETQEKVTFMSLHAAKGLEFRICFIAGMEEGLFPSARAFDSYQRTEEERRLCYVGITRAREKLYLTRTNRRRTFGTINFSVASRFLKDLPKDVLETVADQSETGEAAFFQPVWKRANVRSRSAGVGGQWDDGFDFDQRPPEFDGSLFHKGDRVMHPSFGEGIVQKAELIGSDECLSVVFQKRGLKKVLSKFVQKAG